MTVASDGLPLKHGSTSALYVQVRRWPTAAMFKFMKTRDKVLSCRTNWV